MDAKYVTEKAVALIKKLHNTPIGAVEFSGGWMPERVDAILFNSSASFVIETKITRTDFKADFKKQSRSNGKGIGRYRYYACPSGLIKPEELPEKWGLIYVEEGNKRAEMPVGFGGSIVVGKGKHPQYGWTVPILKMYGSQIEPPPDHPRHRFSFDDADKDIERRYLFALCTRYKSRKFMDTIL